MFHVPCSMKLVIVESPTKAKTISKFLGRDFKVKSSYGHVRDLPEKEMGIDIKKNFQPKYVIPKKSIVRVMELKEEAAKADQVILATDEDREGEAISWHLVSALGLKINEAKRIVFHEITELAIKKALENPRAIDLNLVDAQQARRILDRLVGYELSPFLWKKIRRGLSAGRVQSVALRLIAEREREIEKFTKEEYWIINAQLQKDQQDFLAGLEKQNDKKIEEAITLKLFAGDYKTRKSLIKNKAAAEEIAADLKTADYKVLQVEAKEALRTPPPPFTTSTLQQAAINKLGISSKQTMMIAQKLYEEGHITYMRTDSVNLSLESMLSTKKVIAEKFGKEYALPDPRFYKTKSKGAQEAHEAIRPAYPEKTPADLEGKLETSQLKLYRLIWQRMLACQMQPAIFNSVRADISAKTPKNEYLLKATGSTIKFDGYLKAYGDKAPASEVILPELKKSDRLNLLEVLPEQKFTSAPPRYSEASLVKVMEENGIGRPSTYAPTISTIIERKYVDKNEEKRLYPLEIGLLVNDLLVKHFPEIVDINFTATIEKDFDEIAEGQRKWVPVIKEFYEPFHKNLVSKNKEIKKTDFHEKIDKKCPECGGDLVAKFGRFGKFIACTNFPSCHYTEKTDEEKKVDEVHKDEICEVCGAPMAVKRGKYGAFLGCSNYPECKNIKKIENKTGIKCPKCPDGEIVEKKSKRGKLFYACNKYPACKFALWSKPTGEKCPKCSSLMVFAAQGKTKCSSKECLSLAKNTSAEN
ncbi:MAG: type I DNA topoisomerase [Candidatus Moranbacteria bacterium]|nr:type I DNA topoisomerase [Candidatus Moranbacteria bacterium]